MTDKQPQQKIYTYQAALKMLSIFAAIWVTAVVFCSCVITLGTAARGYNAARDFAVASDAARINPVLSIQKLTSAVRQYPFDATYRRELLKPFTTLAAMGYDVPHNLADEAYVQSRLAAGDAPDILLARIWYLVNARVTSDGAQATEARALLSRLENINPKFPELSQTRKAMERAGM